MTGWNSWDEMTQEMPRLPPAFFDDPRFAPAEDEFRAGGPPPVRDVGPASEAETATISPVPLREPPPGGSGRPGRARPTGWRPATPPPAPAPPRPPGPGPVPLGPTGPRPDPGPAPPHPGPYGPGQAPPRGLRPPPPPTPGQALPRGPGQGPPPGAGPRSPGDPAGAHGAHGALGAPGVLGRPRLPGAPGRPGGPVGPGRPGDPGRPDDLGSPGRPAGPGRTDGFGSPGRTDGFGGPGRTDGFGGPGRPDGFGGPDGPGRGVPAQWDDRRPADRATWDPLGDETVVIRLDQGVVAPTPATARAPSAPGIGRASRTMAIASAASRLTGFLRSLAIAAVIGVQLVGNAYNTANTLPNIVYELLLGGVLTSVIVPLLVHAQERDPDGGEEYTQRLLTVTLVALAGATVLATLAAPLLTRAYVPTGGDKAELTTFFAYLLLPEIFFYGLGAMIGAILNTRGIFGAPAWAPVLNNVVVIAVAGLFLVVTRGAGLRVTESLTTGEVLLLGIGTTLGIVVQAVVLLPALRRTGFRWRARWDLRGARLGEAGGLALWVVGYVVVSQVGYFVQVRLANGVPDDEPGQAVLTFSSLLFQMPYGILGVSLLTALMPRMSRAAARGDRASVLADLSLGARLSALALLPVTALFVVLGPAIGTVVFAHGRTEVSQARDIGTVLAVSAFGLVPFAVTMLQLRVFYAVKDARTPTWINVGMVGAKVVLSLLAAAVLDDRHLVAGLMVATSLSYVVGAVAGEVLLRRRFGRLDTARTVRASAGFLVLSAAAGLAAWAVLAVVSGWLGTGVAGSLLAVLLGSAIAAGVLVLLAATSRSAELDDVLRGLRGRPAAPGPGTGSGRHRAGRGG